MKKNSFDHSPTPVGELIPQLIGNLLSHPSSQGFRLWREWREAVGESIARQSEPIRLAEGVLTVRVTSSAWVTQLTFLKPEIVAKLQEKLPGRKIRELRFQQGTLRHNEPLEQTVRPLSLPPPLPEEEERAKAAVALATDPDIKQILYRIFLKQMQRERMLRDAPQQEQAD